MQVTNQEQKGDDTMFKMTTLFRKIALVVLVVTVGLAAFPFAGASAASLNGQTAPQPDNSRLEKTWAREQAIYRREGTRLANSSNFIARIQILIDKANQKGWDTSSLQAALNSFSAVLPAVQAAHASGAAIIASHAGFDSNGKITDRSAAIATVKSLGQVLKDTRTAMNGTGKALRQAIKTFRHAHPRPTTPPVP
jgi:hypothetical protein